MVVPTTLVGLGQLRQPKVKNLHLPIRSQKNIRRFDVAVHDALGMGGGQRVRHLHRDVQQVVKVQSLTMDSLLQALAFELFHDDEGVPVVVLNVVDGADVGMVELRCGARLSHKSFQRARIRGQVLGDEFQRDMPAQAEILRLVNNSHSAAAQLRQHAVMGHRLPDYFHGRVWGGHSCPPAFAFDSTGEPKLARAVTA